MGSSEPSPILAFFLKLTRFAGEHKVPVLEWILAWSTVVIFGLRYIIDYARLRWRLNNLANSVVKSAEGTTTRSQLNEISDTANDLCDCISLCPLAHTRKELSVGTEERWERLRRALFLASSNIDHDGEEKKDATMTSIDIDSEDSSKPSPSQIVDMTKEWTDAFWVQVFRSDLNVRREASYLMYGLSGKLPSSKKESMVLSKMRKLWPRFLELPRSVVTAKNSATVYDISLIIPMYRERITDISSTLNKAFQRCKGDPKKIQVIVAHAESKPNENSGNSVLREQLLLQEERQEDESPAQSIWGELKVVTILFGQGGGRGRTLNIGAGQATAPILTFLHADTLLPFGWDQKIKGAFVSSEESFAQACAFTMAIDDDDACYYQLSPTLSQQQRKPPGLVGAEWLGVLRCNCGLPYGDSVLSFERPIFDYMGGYPDQPLMEDYEVMDWLRLRSVLLTTIHKMTKASNRLVTRGEHLALLQERAWCSPRRWNKYGVAYTSLINAVCILRYRNKATTEELFDFYYHCNNSSKVKKQD